MEQVRCVLLNLRKPKIFGVPEVYNVAITDSRCLFARLTSEMLRRAADEANRLGKEEGKGFLARWADQMTATTRYGEKYLAMSPEDILKENRGNFAIDHKDIRSVTFRKRRRVENKHQAVHGTYFEVIFDTVHGKSSYHLDFLPEQEMAVVRALLGDKLRY